MIEDLLKLIVLIFLAHYMVYTTVRVAMRAYFRSIDERKGS